jgi:hypothetical protein
MSLAMMKKLYIGEKGMFYCDGLNFPSCLSNGRLITEFDDLMYHCHECGYDMCPGCMEEYGEIHIHHIEPMTLRELNSEDSRYWGYHCDLARP